MYFLLYKLSIFGFFISCIDSSLNDPVQSNHSYTLNIKKKNGVSNGRMRSFNHEEHIELEQLLSMNITENSINYTFNEEDIYNQTFNQSSQTTQSSQTVLPYIFPMEYYNNQDEFEERKSDSKLEENIFEKKISFLKTNFLSMNKSSNILNKTSTNSNQNNQTLFLLTSLRNLTNNNDLINRTFYINVPKKSEIFENQRFCLSSSDCYLELNERCILKEKYSICDCAKSFFRDEFTRRCQINKLIRTVFKVTFSHDNKSISLNKNSHEFLQFRTKLDNNLWFYINYSNYLNLIIQKTEFVEFNPSNQSITLDFYLKNRHIISHNSFIENNFIQEISSKLSQTLKTLIDDQVINFFNVEEIFDDLDPCTIHSLNYCNENSYCTRIENSEIGFRCSCKNSFTDLSPHPQFIGEICQIQCTSDYCYNDGFCIINNAKSLECKCFNWDFGNRCQFSGILVVSIAGLLLVMLIIILTFSLSIICLFKFKKDLTSSNKDIESESNKPLGTIFNDEDHYDLPHPYTNQNVIKFKKKRRNSSKETFPLASLDNDNDSIHNFQINTNANKPRKSSFAGNKIPKITATHVTWC